MKYSIRKNWLSSFDFIKSNPVVLLPFIFIAFFEALASELIYFSTAKPISIVTGPIVKKYIGEDFMHYPGSLMFLPNAFYYAQVLIYIFIGVFMAAVSVNIFKNKKAGLPVRVDALAKNALKSYLSYFIYGIIAIILMILIKRVDTFTLSKVTQALFKNSQAAAGKFYFIGMSLASFLTNVLLHAFIVLAIPIMVMQKKPVFKALGASIYMGFRNFFSVFSLIFIPFMAYLPVMLLKSMSTILANKTFPELTLYIVTASIIISVFVDCFVIVCASQFLADKEVKP